MSGIITDAKLVFRNIEALTDEIRKASHSIPDNISAKLIFMLEEFKSECIEIYRPESL